MSEPESVLVAVGAGPKPRIPKQNYENIVTKYNMAPAGPDPAFFIIEIVFHNIVEIYYVPCF